jgi:hypothetical protein
MQFRSTEDQNVTVYVEHRCGDGCCSWSEREDDWVKTNEVYEPDFEYGAYMRVDEDCFRNDVEAGLFVPLDDEAKAWVKNESGN